MIQTDTVEPFQDITDLFQQTSAPTTVTELLTEKLYVNSDKWL